MLLVQRAYRKTIMMSARADQAIEKPCAVTQMELAIPFPCGDGNRPRYINHRVKGKFLFYKFLFAAVAAPCKQLRSGDDRISQLTLGKAVHPFFSRLVSTQEVNKDRCVYQPRDVSHPVFFPYS